MKSGRIALVVAFLAVASGLTWLIFSALPRWYGTRAPLANAATSAPTPTPGEGRKIKAQLFYVAEAGTTLTGVEHDVPYAEQAVDQAREILNAQLEPVAEPLVSAVPAGTTLRALFLTPEGEAFVDLSVEVSAAHPGGSLNEILTVYTFVHALMMNLPAVSAVQLLVNGKEVDTLAGHVDLRRPLTTNFQLTMDP